ncbi:MAG TPA: GNAT family N-acetyltransferase [Verrucomicrobiae bacterium]|nr:GNAT family N-acetyltransferase [Verrucomicrobiae bacterium]
MAHSLWPDGAVSEHAAQFAAYIAGDGPGELPDAIFVAEDPAGSLVGFAHAGLRSHADGCDPSHPVGYLEGWYVAPSHRRMRVGAQLVAAAEGWARSLGCREMASDTWIDSFDSQQAHQALGYEVVDRCVHYRKNL